MLDSILPDEHLSLPFVDFGSLEVIVYLLITVGLFVIGATWLLKVLGKAGVIVIDRWIQNSDPSRDTNSH